VEADGDQWYEIKGAFKLEKQPSKVTAYVQGPPPGVDLRVMDLQIYPVDRKARFEYLKEKTDKVSFNGFHVLDENSFREIRIEPRHSICGRA
jgi:hypothetical protein